MSSDLELCTSASLLANLDAITFFLHKNPEVLDLAFSEPDVPKSTIKAFLNNAGSEAVENLVLFVGEMQLFIQRFERDRVAEAALG